MRGRLLFLLCNLLSYHETSDLYDASPKGCLGFMLHGMAFPSGLKGRDFLGALVLRRL